MSAPEKPPRSSLSKAKKDKKVSIAVEATVIGPKHGETSSKESYIAPMGTVSDENVSDSSPEKPPRFVLVGGGENEEVASCDNDSLSNEGECVEHSTELVASYAEIESEELADDTGLREARLNSAMSDAFKGKGCPDDKAIRKLLLILVNIATEGKILSTNASYIGGLGVFRTSYAKQSENELLISYDMSAESPKYGVIEIKFQYKVVKEEKGQNYVGGFVYAITEGEFTLNGSHADVRDTAVSITKNFEISQDKWNAFVDKHNELRKAEDKKRGLLFKFMVLVTAIWHAVAYVLAKIFNGIAGIFHDQNKTTVLNVDKKQEEVALGNDDIAATVDNVTEAAVIEATMGSCGNGVDNCVSVDPPAVLESCSLYGHTHANVTPNLSSKNVETDGVVSSTDTSYVYSGR